MLSNKAVHAHIIKTYFITPKQKNLWKLFLQISIQ